MGAFHGAFVQGDGGPDAGYDFPLDRQGTISRDAVSGVVSPVTQALHVAYFTADRSANAVSISTVTGTTAGATVTLSRVALFTAAADGSLTLVSSPVNDATMWVAANTRYTKTLATPVAISAGVRYAIGALFVGTTPPTLLGAGTAASFTVGMGLVDATAPRRAAIVAAQTDIPATVAVGSLAASIGRLYAELVYG